MHVMLGLELATKAERKRPRIRGFPDAAIAFSPHPMSSAAVFGKAVAVTDAPFARHPVAAMSASAHVEETAAARGCAAVNVGSGAQKAPLEMKILSSL